MKEKWNYVLYLLWFSYLVMSATLMFSRGFMLARKTLNDVSECLPLNEIGCDGRALNSTATSSKICSDAEKIAQIMQDIDAPLVCIPTQTRVAIVVVDAFRYDFAEYEESLERPFFYQNKVPVIHEVLERWPERARLFRFVADPPTTTTQRLKALVTGSLPTFIDAGANFAAMELLEDNIIDQVRRAGGNTVLLGDDTWGRLLPGRWTRSHALYSFHTWDLDTVDKEVDSKIFDEVQRDDWQLLVAHYLGVDHAGHRYGPNHPEMARKLTELDRRLRRLLELLPPDVLLYVLGDHGMTDSGDHGGESMIERVATLFTYRGSGLGAGEAKTGREVRQTDLAPTLSAALGRPPPAPSLGGLLPAIMPPATLPDVLMHLRNNVLQVSRYLTRYGEESTQLSPVRLAQVSRATRDLLSRAAHVQEPADLIAYTADVWAVLGEARAACHEAWVEFDSLAMLRALLLLMVAFLFSWILAEGIPSEQLPLIFASSFVPCGLFAVITAIGGCFITHAFGLIEDLEHAIILFTGLASGLVICILIVMYWDGISQRWYEAQSFWYQRIGRAALVASAGALLSNSFVIEEGAGLSFLFLTALLSLAFSIGTLRAFALWGTTGVVLALTRSYRACREEQGACWTLGTASNVEASRASLVLALLSVGMTVAGVRRCGVGWWGYGAVVAGVLVSAHWAVGWGSLGSQRRSRMLARSAWLTLGVLWALLWRREGRPATSVLIMSALLLYLANALVLGASWAPAAALALVTARLTMLLVASGKSEGSSKFSLSTRCDSSVACVWALLAMYQFYGTGHHATLAHIRWAAAFHAGDAGRGLLGQAVSAALVLLNTFGMPLMFGATTPLLVLWTRAGLGAGSRTQLAAVFALCLKFSLCFALRLLVCMVAATVHCRHLMVWGVFAPKLLFESGVAAAAMLGAALGAALTARHLGPARRS